MSPYVGKLKMVESIVGKNFKKFRSHCKLLVDCSNPVNCDYTTLNYFIDNGFKVRTLKLLHAKVYIADNESIVTSANLSQTAFEKRSEIGIHLEAGYISEVEAVFNRYWNEAKDVDRFSDKEIRKQKNKNPGEKGSKKDKANLNSVRRFFEIPVSKNQAWLKISGFSDYERRKEPFNFSNARIQSFIGCRKFRNDGGPRLKENEVVIMSRMSINKNNEKDHSIYGRAIVDIPYRDDRDDMVTYIGRINPQTEGYRGIIRDIRKWHKGFWIKQLEMIEDESEFISLTELKERHPDLFGSLSVNEQSHVRLNEEQVDFINNILDRKVGGRIYNPQGTWLNRHITNPAQRIRKNRVR